MNKVELQNSINEAIKIKQRLINIRKERKISQTSFAKIMGIGQPNLAKFECDDSSPKFCNIIKYAKALGLKSIDLE